MIIRSAEFVKSSGSYKDCPVADKPEYAFLGRSNVGKSSLINMITSRNKLAKTSSSPGKTRLINHFQINDAWYLCDLPGYGFAKVSTSVSSKWEKMIKDYLLKRENLLCSFILIDIRHGPMKNDMAFLEWIGKNHIPFCLVYTKADKLSRSRIRQYLSGYEKKLSSLWEPLPASIITSSSKWQGGEEVLDLISGCNKQFVSGRL